MTRAAFLAVAALLGAAAAPAEEKPLLLPRPDVDVTYRFQGPQGPLEQRLRWSAQLGRMRIDPPQPGLYVIIDTRTRRTETVQDQGRVVLQMDGAAPALPTAAASAHFTRLGDTNVGGLACTEWQTADADGVPTVACITLNGVMLRARRGAGADGKTLVEAVHVEFGAQDTFLFQAPSDYRRIIAPSLSR